MPAAATIEYRGEREATAVLSLRECRAGAVDQGRCIGMLYYSIIGSFPTKYFTESLPCPVVKLRREIRWHTPWQLSTRLIDQETDLILLLLGITII
jgi:hypothetical protein